MTAYYNENDPFAAAWLRELIACCVIEEGEVDERNIQSVTPADIKGFDRCHFFAGIGVWSYALAQAKAQDLKCWTGSCPCQPFSVAGRRSGASDERHLWPVWYNLIKECRPELVFGEQVASDDGLAWLDLVSSNLEDSGYAVGAVDTCAAGFGAPILSQRLYFMAAPASRHSIDGGKQSSGEHRLRESDRDGVGTARIEEWSQTGSVAEAERRRCEQRDQRERSVPESDEGSDLGEASGRGRGMRGGAPRDGGWIAFPGAAGIMGETCGKRRQQISGSSPGHEAAHGRAGRDALQPDGNNFTAGAGATNGFWQNADWIPCRDGKYRPTQPGLFPLAHGIAGRVGRLRGYGNALVAPQAIAFIEAALDIL